MEKTKWLPRIFLRYSLFRCQKINFCRSGGCIIFFKTALKSGHVFARRRKVIQTADKKEPHGRKDRDEATDLRICKVRQIGTRTRVTFKVLIEAVKKIV